LDDLHAAANGDEENMKVTQQSEDNDTAQVKNQRRSAAVEGALTQQKRNRQDPSTVAQGVPRPSITPMRGAEVGKVVPPVRAVSGRDSDCEIVKVRPGGYVNLASSDDDDDDETDTDTERGEEEDEDTDTEPEKEEEGEEGEKEGTKEKDEPEHKAEGKEVAHLSKRKSKRPLDKAIEEKVWRLTPEGHSQWLP